MAENKEILDAIALLNQDIVAASGKSIQSNNVVIDALNILNQNFVTSANNAMNQNSAIITCLARLHLDSILSDPQVSGELRLEKHGFQVFSQGDEDGIIDAIFSRIGTESRIFVEFGAGAGMENNTIYLLLQGWSGLWIEGSPSNAKTLESNFEKPVRDGALKIINQFVNKDNINKIIGDSGFSGEIDLLSIDIDGNDYHVFEAIDVVKPRVVVAEYNGKIRPPVRWVMPYNEKHEWDGTFYYGASLSALEELYRKKGYSLVGCSVTGINVFFVRSDLAIGKFEEPFTAEHHYHPPRSALASVFKLGPPPTPKLFNGP